MIGMMTWTPPAGGVRQKSVVLETRALLHLRVAWASVARGPRTPEALVRRRVLTAAKRLRKAGVTRLVVPEAFAYGEQLEKVGVAPVSTLPLRRALAADLARAVMAGRNLSGGSARLAVAGDQLSGELVRTVTELALGNRYVLLDVPYGGDTLANQLRREYGVSLLLSPTRQQMEEADVLVLFAALTSSIALTESAVSTFEDELGWSRERATALIGLIMVALGSLSALGYGPLAGVTVFGMQFLDFFDFLTNSVMMPIAAIAICLLVSRVIGVQKIEEEVTLGGKPFRRKKIFNFMIQYLCPIFAAIILISSVANALGWIAM